MPNGRPLRSHRPKGPISPISAACPSNGLAEAPPATVPDARRCADQVMAVVPAVMDALRVAMRSHVGDQLSVPQFRCLNFIALTPGSSVGAVAAFLGVTMPTASAMVDRLVRAGALQHDADPTDRRRLRLMLTPAGLAQLKLIRRGARDDLTRTLSGQSARDLQALLTGLEVLRDTFTPATPA